MTKLPDTILTAKEAQNLRDAEHTIEQGKSAFVEVGQALEMIRNSRLYRTAHNSFEEYCQARWGWSRQRASQIIKAQEYVKSLPESSQPVVDTERKAREARKPSSQPVVDSPGGASEPEKPKEKVIDLDKEGNVIPEAILEDWQHADEVGRKIYSLLSEVKDLVKTGLTDGKRDLAFAEIANPTLAEIDALRYALGQVVPYVLCPSCSGKTRKTCTRCRHRGWISKFLFKNTASKEEKGKK